MFIATRFLPNISLTKNGVAKFILCLSNQRPYKRGYQVDFSIIIYVSKYDLKSALRGYTGVTNVILRDESHSRCKLDLKTLK